MLVFTIALLSTIIGGLQTVYTLFVMYYPCHPRCGGGGDGGEAQSGEDPPTKTVKFVWHPVPQTCSVAWLLRKIRMKATGTTEDQIEKKTTKRTSTPWSFAGGWHWLKRTFTCNLPCTEAGKAAAPLLAAAAQKIKEAKTTAKTAATAAAREVKEAKGVAAAAKKQAVAAAKVRVANAESAVGHDALAKATKRISKAKAGVAKVPRTERWLKATAKVAETTKKVKATTSFPFCHVRDHGTMVPGKDALNLPGDSWTCYQCSQTRQFERYDIKDYRMEEAAYMCIACIIRERDTGSYEYGVWKAHKGTHICNTCAKNHSPWNALPVAKAALSAATSELKSAEAENPADAQVHKELKDALAAEVALPNMKELKGARAALVAAKLAAKAPIENSPGVKKALAAQALLKTSTVLKDALAAQAAIRSRSKSKPAIEVEVECEFIPELPSLKFLIMPALLFIPTVVGWIAAASGPITDLDCYGCGSRNLYDDPAVAASKTLPSTY